MRRVQRDSLLSWGGMCALVMDVLRPWGEGMKHGEGSAAGNNRRGAPPDAAPCRKSSNVLHGDSCRGLLLVWAAGQRVTVGHERTGQKLHINVVMTFK